MTVGGEFQFALPFLKCVGYEVAGRGGRVFEGVCEGEAGVKRGGLNYALGGEYDLCEGTEAARKRCKNVGADVFRENREDIASGACL